MNLLAALTDEYFDPFPARVFQRAALTVFIEGTASLK